MSHLECEYKWEAAPRGAFARFVQALQQSGAVASGPQVLSITDYYLDHAGGYLSARHVALRIRRCGGQFEATLKSRTALRAGLARRHEFTLALPQARSVTGALRALGQRRSWAGYPMGALRVRFVLRNRRQVYQVRWGACRCEAALDRYAVCACGQQLRRKEIELEHKRGPLNLFEKKVKEISVLCGLPPVQISKVAGAEKWLSEKISLN